MKKINVLVALLFIAASPLSMAGGAVATPAADAKPAAQEAKKPPVSKKLNRSEVDALLAKPNEVVFIDLRRPDELTKIGGFPVFLNIQAKELEKYAAYIPKDKAVATISNHAGRAHAGADLLISKGFKVVGAIGAQDYEAEGGILTKIAPPAPKYEVAKEIPGVVAKGTKYEFLYEGFEGTEGPIALPDGSAIFTETRANRITQLKDDRGIAIFLQNSNGSNGLAFNPKGELISVQNLKPQVGIIYPAGKEKVLSDQFEGKPFQRPNDLVLDKKGGIYFTDIGIVPKPEDKAAEAARPAVYYITPEGKTTRVINDLKRPNGVQLSTDEKTLYVADTANEFVIAYDIKADGALGNKSQFAKLAGYAKNAAGESSSGADGLAVDAENRVYVASNAGVEVFSAKGETLGVIALPNKPQNLAFSGKDKKTLFVVGRGAAYRIPLLAQGYLGRVK
ncbi:MAG: SMP-30/gluconolactonase/LRE family protein [Pseudomonadota bacterium]